MSISPDVPYGATSPTVPIASTAPNGPTAIGPNGADSAVAVARVREDVIVGDEIVRHRLSTRIVHWSAALTFVVCLVTGMPIWSPIFGWLAHLVGGLAVCRWLHPWMGVAFSAAMVAMFALWWRDMILDSGDRGWLGTRVITYMRYQDDDPNVGKYNGGQKLYFWAVSLGTIGLLLSGIVLWLPTKFGEVTRELSIILHDFTFICFAVSLVFHVYLGTSAEPGTFRSMTRGTVTKPWARLHHPRWWREISGDRSRPGT
jgi:formate dehydrogenase subunit gamma